MISRNILISFYLISVFYVNKFETQIIKTTSGSVKGQTLLVLNKTIEQYLGIPYAEPPVGRLRFAKPKPLEKPIEVSIELNSFKVIITRFVIRV